MKDRLATEAQRHDAITRHYVRAVVRPIAPKRTGFVSLGNGARKRARLPMAA